MPRTVTREVPRWKRGRQQGAPMPVQLRGRHARAFARELAKLQGGQQQGSEGRKAGKPGTATANDVLAHSGAWRFRRHLQPFAWLAGLLAAGAWLHASSRPLLFGLLASVVLPGLMMLAARPVSAWARRFTGAEAALSSLWLPVLAVRGLHPCIAALLITWAPFAALWARRYRWRPAPQEEVQAVASDVQTWGALAARRKWAGRLTDPEDIPGGRKWQIRLDGIETHIGEILSQPRAIAAAFHKAQTEAYAEPHPTGIESRGMLTILRGGTLEDVRAWDGQGIGADGFAVIGRFADSQPARVRFWVPRDGTRHGLIAGTSGAGKSVLLDLLVWLAITSPVPVVPVILDPQNGQSLPQWRDKVPYAAGVSECISMLRGLHAGMMRRSYDLAGMTWTNAAGQAGRGLPFFDHALTGLPVIMPIIDEAPVMLAGGGNARLAAEAVRLLGDIAKLARKTGLSVWPVAQVPSLAELGDQVVRSMLVGGNVVCLRTGDRVSGGMLGLEVDPAALPKAFPNGEPTGGLGYTIGPDNRQAPMRVSPVPESVQFSVPPIAQFDESFADAMSGRAFTQPQLTATAPEPEQDAPEGRRCADAVWQVLADSGKPMERGEIIKWVNELAVTGWGRDKPFSIRAIGDALRDLAAGKAPGRTVTKPRDGVYRAVAGDSARNDQETGAA